MIRRVLALAALTLVYTTTVAARTVATTIFGESITEDEVEQRTKLNLLMSKPSARQDVIGELADDKDQLARAARAKALPSDDQVETWFAGMATRFRGDLIKSLGEHGIRPETLKQLIKADAVRSSRARFRYYHYQDGLRTR